MISVFTPSHNPRFLNEAYASLLSQTVTDWEWVVLLNGNAGPWTPPADDERVKVFTSYNTSGYVGALKREACSRCTGDLLLELDHDDRLLPEALMEVGAAFDDPEVGFAYSNTVHAILRPGSDQLYQVNRFDESFGWRYRDFDYHGTALDEHISFDPSPEAVSRIWFAPNHLRVFRRSVYEQVGGYNSAMRILDDMDLMCRLYQVSKFRHIDRGLYLYIVHGGNTWLQPEINPEIQNNVYRVYDQYIESLAERSAEQRGLRKVELGGRMAAKAGFETVDLKDADLVCDLNGDWPFADSSVGVIRAFDVFEHLRDPLRVMKELYRVLAPGGFAFIQVPSTDGRGAFQDPTHVSYWNINTFKYFSEARLSKYLDTPVRFQAPRLYDSERNEDGVIWTRAHLISLKDGYRPCGLVSI